jgi:uncharacterized alpha-E superfamily protein
MISRVAESCFWLHRYLERLDSTSRLLGINRDFVLDVRLAPQARWWPLIIVAGEQERFTAEHGGAEAADGELVQSYLTWERDCPVSIASSLYWARENARTIREVISLEMWEALNGLWRWLNDGDGRAEWERDRSAFYRRVRTFTAIFQGLAHNTILHEEPFDFMRLGSLLERAGQTARVVDVFYHRLGVGIVEGDAAAAAHWIAVLRSCAAFEPFHKRSRQAPTGPGVVEFLIHDDAFPRSVVHCLTRAWNFLKRIGDRGPAEVGQASRAALRALCDSVHRENVRDSERLHAELTRIIDGTSELCEVVHREYFDPRIDPGAQPEDEPGAGSGGASQQQSQSV